MKIHRFIDNFDLNKPELEIGGEIAHQIIKVLKLKKGEKIELSDGKGISAMAEIEKIGEKILKVKVNKIIQENKNIKEINLFCAVLKKENFELVVQKATECGVSKIIPIITSRTVKTGLNLERLQKIAKEASEQSGRTTVPEISEPINFSSCVKSTEGQGKEECNIMFDSSGELLYKTPWEPSSAKATDGQGAPVRQSLGEGGSTRNFSAEKYPCVLESNTPRINIWIGPEGGWTEKEIEEVKNLNFKIASLGPLTLRGETAAIIATYLASNL